MMFHKTTAVKIDLHCHSWASNRPALWLMQRLGCPESFTPPEQVRETAMQRGMDFITITDHNTIDGVNEVEQYDNVIVGNEITTYFPDGVKIHVVCLGITKEQFEVIQTVRENIDRLVDYLNEQDIVHFCAHPLHKVNGRLQWEHFEKMILLFKRFEILNGTRLRRLNQLVEAILSNLNPTLIDELSKKHGIKPVGERPWIKYVTGGSDDHSGLFVGTCYTEVEVTSPTKEGVLEAIRQGRTRACGDNDGCLTLAHQVNSIAFQYYSSKIGPESQEILTVLGHIFQHKTAKKEKSIKRFRKNLKKIFNYFRKPKGIGINLYEEIRGVLFNNKALRSLFQEGFINREEFNRNVFYLSSDVLDEMILQIIRKPKFIPYFMVFAPALMASYVMSTKNLHDEKDLIAASEQWLGLKREPKVAWFTDSLTNMDGVSKTCRSFLDAACRRDKQLTLVTSTLEPIHQHEHLVNFPPIYTFPLPGYEKVNVSLPSILKVLKFVEDHEFDSIVVSTPGPVGLIGVLLGKLMQIPVYGIYHTDLPRIALQISDDAIFGELAMTMTKLFYSYLDSVYAPSRWYMEDIEKIGVKAERIRLLERWVNHETFSPNHRDETYWNALQPVKLLYVGRIAKDKNLDLLMHTYEQLAEANENFVLHVVGDGPEFESMRIKTAKWDRFIMTGAKYSDDLAKAYASSDLFVYPGLLDTFGNVIIEAQASGLPCVVMNEGGPKELILNGKTGLAANTEQSFVDAVKNLLDDEELRQQMSIRAAQHAVEYFTEERIFNQFWGEITPERASQLTHASVPQTVWRVSYAEAV